MPSRSENSTFLQCFENFFILIYCQASKQNVYFQGNMNKSEDDFQFSSSQESSPNPSSCVFKRHRCKADRMLDKLIEKIYQPTEKSGLNLRKKHEGFGEHILVKLRSISPRMLPICQKLINDAIYFAEINALNITSQIVWANLPSPT